jgi:hypothetical protein
MRSASYLLFSLLLAAVFAPRNAHSADSPRYLFGTATPVTELNAPGVADVAISLTPDGLEAFFARATFDPTTDLRTSAEIYTARRASTSDPFGTPQRVAEWAPPVTYGDAAPSISEDGLTLYFGRALNGASQPSEALRLPTQGIYAATRPSRDEPFAAPQEIMNLRADDDPGALGRPEISADGLSLYMQYFHLNPRDSDVYVSHRASVDGPWGLAEPIAEFSTSDLANYLWESAPGLSADGQGLFLELGWYGGSLADLPDQRGVDIYFAKRDGQGGWSKPVNLGNAINLASDYQTDPFLTADGSTLYFNRAVLSPEVGPQGTTWDLYHAPVLRFETVGLSGAGGEYSQDFSALGTDSSHGGTPLPIGWTFTANDVVFNNTTTGQFPAPRYSYAGAYNAGESGDSDRALTTMATTIEQGELHLRAEVTDSPLAALELSFDIEAWQVQRNPGEAAFHVLLEADAGSGFQTIADLGTVTTGPTLARPANGRDSNGNDPAYRLSYDSGPIQLAEPVPVGATLRARWISVANTNTRLVVFGLDNVSLQSLAAMVLPDYDGNGVVDQGDLDLVLLNWGADATAPPAGWINDVPSGQVDQSELDKVLLNWGSQAAAGLPVESVPEPTTAAALMIIVACVGARLGVQSRLRDDPITGPRLHVGLPF